MRFHVLLDPLRGRRLLPYDHQYLLMSWIYRVLEEKLGSTAGMVHDLPGFKPFTFSYVLSEKRKPVKSGVLCYGRTGFFFSTPDPELGRLFSHAVAHEVVRLGSSFEAIVSSVSILKEPDFGERAVFRSLSPVVVRKNDADLLPTEPGFYERLSGIVQRKYYDFTGMAPGRISFRVEGDVKIKRHRVRKGYCKGVLFSRLVVTGDPGLIAFGYQAGFGSRTGEGFGMVEVIRE